MFVDFSITFYSNKIVEIGQLFFTYIGRAVSHGVG